MALNFLRSISNALGKTRHAIRNRIQNLFGSGISESSLEQLEELLYEADLGVATASELTEKTASLHKQYPNMSVDQLLEELESALLEMIETDSAELSIAKEGPTVILIVGVNGNGKTTTIARLANHYKKMGKTVLLGAADTFRAAAVEQLDTWAKRLELPIVKGQNKADPSAVVFDAVTAAVSRKADVLLLDTAGRLQTKTDLMKELEKMRRSCSKVLPEAPHETLLVLDASTGQNAIDQAKVFSNYVPLTGLILTKLDGTAKGGIAVPITRDLKIPIRFIGTGEGENDLETFDAKSYVHALFSSSGI